MQSMPLLLRQSLRSSANLSRTSRPVRPQFLPAPRPSLLVSRNTRRNFSICLQCQFRSQPIFYSSHETDRLKEENVAQQSKEASSTTPLPEEVLKHEPVTDSQRTHLTGGENDTVQRQERDEKNGTNPDGIETGGLPSYLENRRSQFSKQFTTMMDNLQANVFVAGQRLNDLTGYSSIEVLKKNIQAQEERLRNARLRVREAKDAYAAAINRRSASQREINELLQRKHAWSAADLERFTHLYRNDHANEVAETETQEALSVAERQSEETAAQLSKSILSRYHEEQVWSDKIRRMSTWGTWGLMGVNVLLFLIFQIAVEPWRRKRLVKGFEEKVIEALEKEKAVNHIEVLNTGSDLPQESPVAPQDISGSSVPVASETPSVANEIATSDTPALDSAATSSSLTTTETTTGQLTEDNTDNTDKNTMNSVLETFKFHLSRIQPPQVSVESWRQALHDLFSDRSIDITQRDLTAVSIQSAAAGAAIMALVIALIQQ